MLSTARRHHRTLTRPPSRSFLLLPFYRHRLALRSVTERCGYAAGRAWVAVRVEEVSVVAVRREGVVEARAEEPGSKREKEKAEREKREKEKAEREREQAEREKAEREKREKEKAEREKAEREKREKEKREKEKAEREKAERERKEKEKKEKERADKERAEKQRAEKEKREKEKAEREKKEKEKKEKDKQEKEKEKEKEKAAKEKLEKEKAIKASPKDSKPIDLPVKTAKASTSDILAKIIKAQTQELKKMAPPALPEKPTTSPKEVAATPDPKATTTKVTNTKSQPTSVAPNTGVGDLKKVAKETPPASLASIKTENITTPPAVETVPATGVPKNGQEMMASHVEEGSLKPHRLNIGRDPKESQDSPDADIDLLLPSDVRTAAGIPSKPQVKAETESEKIKQHPTTQAADTNTPPAQKKPRESPEELRKRMQRIAASLDLGPIEKFIPAKDHHHHEHDYEWSGTENVSTEDVLKPVSSTPAPVKKPVPKPPSQEPTPLIEPVLPTMPFTEPPALPTQPPAAAAPPPPPPPPPPTPKNYYVLVRNPDSGSMHFTPLPSSLISDFPTLSRESTAFDALRQLAAPKAFLPLWWVLQRGGFEVVGGEKDCLVVKVDAAGSKVKRGEVLKELRGLLSPAERVAREVWERRRREERAESVARKIEEAAAAADTAEAGVAEVEKEKLPGRKIFWSAVWVAACTGAVTVGLEHYM